MINRAIKLALLLGLLIVSPAQAHEAPSGWSYPPACCSGHDCAPLDAQRIKETGNDFLIDGKFLVKRADAKLSPDGIYHACFSVKNQGPNCFWYPPNSY